VLPVIANVLSQMQDQAARDGVRLCGPALDTALVIHSDEHFFTRMLMNLVGNGIKYHDPARRERIVQLTLQPAPTCLRLSIEDNGIGMAAELLRSEDIFKPFFQAANPRRESEKGVGLGLSIVRAMLDLLPHHRIEVQSTPAQGTRITLELPWGQALAPSHSPGPETADTPPANEVADLRGIYVLYVEDDELVRHASCALFDSYGLRYESAANLSDLHVVLSTMERRPDLLISDFRLPDGKTAVDVVRALDAVFGATPTLVLTGESWNDKLMNPGWTVRSKPISTAQLLGTMQDLVQHNISVSATDRRDEECEVPGARLLSSTRYDA